MGRSKDGRQGCLSQVVEGFQSVEGGSDLP